MQEARVQSLSGTKIPLRNSRRPEEECHWGRRGGPGVREQGGCQLCWFTTQRLDQFGCSGEAETRLQWVKMRIDAKG